MPARQIYVTAQPQSGSMIVFSNLRLIGRRLLHLWPFCHLIPLVRGVFFTAEPAGRLWIQKTPTLEVSEDRQSITVITANLWHDWPRQRALLERLESFAQLVEKERADIILLQEVSRSADFQVDAWLEKRLGMAYIYSRANGHNEAIGFEEGLAIFSRFPLGEPVLRQFSSRSNPFVRRLALGASIQTPGGHLMAFSVHLGLLPHHNYRQFGHLHDWITQIVGKSSALIGGDFNAHEDRPQIKKARQSWVDTFRHLHHDADGTTHSLRFLGGKIVRQRRLDYIFLHPGNQSWQVVEARLLDAIGVPHSDHRAVLTRLVLAPVLAR